ncbi:MAG TPA: hypothetical protein VNE62_05255 [Actinomycetota bacterium]|nr:hypothetical protein [Actinomycetota bacterium]
MRRIAATITLAAALLAWAVPAQADTTFGPYDYSRGTADQFSGVITTGSGPGYESGEGAVGIRRNLGGSSVITAEYVLTQPTGTGSQAVTVCLRVVGVGEHCAGDYRGQLKTAAPRLTVSAPGPREIEVVLLPPVGGQLPARAASLRVTSISVS